jgi:hypothetical protein
VIASNVHSDQRMDIVSEVGRGFTCFVYNVHVLLRLRLTPCRTCTLNFVYANCFPCEHTYRKNSQFTIIDRYLQLRKIATVLFRDRGN